VCVTSLPYLTHALVRVAQCLQQLQRRKRSVQAAVHDAPDNDGEAIVGSQDLRVGIPALELLVFVQLVDLSAQHQPNASTDGWGARGGSEIRHWHSARGGRGSLCSEVGCSCRAHYLVHRVDQRLQLQRGEQDLVERVQLVDRDLPAGE